MGARLYNSETGRFMSVDPLMDIFTGHSPYHYSYNNPVMFGDPSGLAPEGEKNSKVQAQRYDYIGGSISRGYFNPRNIETEIGKFEHGLGRMFLIALPSEVKIGKRLFQRNGLQR